MIWPTDALQLAVTKLKTRRIRLAVTVVITSLMFGILTFFAFLTEGVVQSLKSFGGEGYGNRYLVQAAPITYGIGGAADAEFMTHFKPIQADLIAQKKAAAKKLGVTYDETNDQALPYSSPPQDKNSVYPNFSSPLVIDYYKQKSNSIPGTDFTSFQKLASDAGAIRTFRGTRTSDTASFGYGAPMTSILKDGSENYDVFTNTNNNASYIEPTGMQTLATMGWNSLDRELMQPFVLPGQNLDVGADNSIPTIAPASVAEEVLGLKKLPSNAAPQEKLNRLSELRTKIAGVSAQLCYRNSASVNAISQALQQQEEIEAGKSKKDFVKPSLIYKLPSTPCGTVTTTTDTRTPEEKKLSDNQKVFDKQFGNYVEPQQGIVTVRIVGISPDIDYNPSMSAINILSSLFNSSLGGRWLSPNGAISGNTTATMIQGGNVDSADRSSSSYFAEFSSLKDMKNFISQQTCDVSETFTSPTGQVIPMGSPDVYAKACSDKHKVFTTAPFGNSIGAIEEFKHAIWSATRIAIVVIVIIASIIMAGNLGKIIADSRRETAVFRALGAKGTDIDQIYLTYTVLVSILAAFFASTIGFVTAMYVNGRYSADLSVAAVLAYSAQDVHKQFVLFGFNGLYLLVIASAVVLSGIFGAAFPLMLNTRRNPIRDMRDDT